jgi:soluble lytic murein transglycosylase
VTLRIVTAVIIIAAALGGCGYWFYHAVYPRMLTFEEKVDGGFLEAAYGQARVEVRRDPCKRTYGQLARILLLRGNIGRADLIVRVTGASEPLVEEVRGFQASVLREAEESGTVSNRFTQGELAELRGFPVYQDLKFFAGYRLALLGDWRGAQDYFLMAERGGVSPELSPYLKYYLARALTKSADTKDSKRGYSLLGKLTDPKDRHGLQARVWLNLLQSAIASDNPGFFNMYLMHIDRLHNSWEYAKAEVAVGDYFLSRDDPIKAAKACARALENYPDSANTRLSAAQGLLKALTVLNGDFRSLEAELATAECSNILYRFAETLDQPNDLAAAAETLRGSLRNGANNSSRFLAMEALSLLYLKQGQKEKLEELLLLENLAPAPENVIQTSYLNNARLLEKTGQTLQARGYYESAAKLEGPRRSEALFEHYSLLKEKAASLDGSAAIRLLTEVVEDAESSNRLKACEELIPLAIAAGRTDTAKRSIEIAGELDDALARFWRIYLAEHGGDAKEAERLRSEIMVRAFSYYELQPLGKLEKKRIECRSAPFYLEDETAAEYLVGLFLTDLACEVSDVSRPYELSAVPAAIVLRNYEFAESVKTSSWFATEMLEQGPMMDGALTSYALRLAYPLPYKDEVAQAAQRYSVPEELIYAVMKKESNFDPIATSKAGARGLMQLMPATAEVFSRFLLPELAGRPLGDPSKNVHLGASYLASLTTAYRQQYLVLSAYNGGPGNLNRWRQQAVTDDPLVFLEIIPNSENEAFVKKTTKYALIYRYVLAAN